MRQFVARFLAPYGLGVNLLALAIAAAFIACNPLHIVHPGGRREVIQARETWKRDQYEIRACAQRWARQYYRDSTITYRDTLMVESQVFAYVYGDGAVYSDGERNHVAGAMQVPGDTILITQRMFPNVDSGDLRITVRHETFHILQASHPELQRPGDNHWAPPWEYCDIPLGATVASAGATGGLSPERHRLARSGPPLLFSHSLPRRSVHDMRTTRATRSANG